MQAASVITILQALNRAGVCYVVCGGLAVIGHGHLRTTRDIDLAVAPVDYPPALDALAGLGFQPSQPVIAGQMHNPAERERLHREKGMVVLNLFSDQLPDAKVDIFTVPPFDVAEERARGIWLDLGPGVAAPCVSLETLLAMKRRAGRHHDLADLEVLELKRRHGLED